MQQIFGGLDELDTNNKPSGTIEKSKPEGFSASKDPFDYLDNDSSPLSDVFAHMDKMKGIPEQTSSDFPNSFGLGDMDLGEDEEEVILGTSKSNDFDLDALDVTETEPPLTEEKPEDNFEGEFDLNSYLDEMHQRILKMVIDFSSIEKHQIGNLEDEVNHMLSMVSSKDINFNFSAMQIEEIIKFGANHPQLQKMHEVLNIRENLKKFSSGVADLKERLEGELTRAINENEIDKNKIIDYISTFKDEQIAKVDNVATRISSIINNESNSIRNDIKRAETLAVDKLLLEHEDVFKEANEIKEYVNDLKEAIIEVLGRNYLSNYNVNFEIPKDKASLKELLDSVDESLDSLNFNRDSAYKLTTSLFKLPFSITKKYSPEGMELFVLGFSLIPILVATYALKPLVILTFAGTVLVDLKRQLSYLGNSEEIETVIGFAQQSDSIIQSLTDTLVGDKKDEVRTMYEPLLDKLDEKQNGFSEKLEELFDVKVNLIEESCEEEEYIERVTKRFGDIADRLNSKMQTLRNDFEEVATQHKVMLEQKLHGYMKEIREYENIDIYAEGNEENIIYRSAYKVGRLHFTDSDEGIDMMKIFKEGSYHIEVNSRDEKDIALEKVKMMIIQQANNLKPGNFKINIIDLAEAGAEMMDMYIEDEEIINLIVDEDKYGEHIKNQYNEIGKRLRKFGKEFESASHFNEGCLVRLDEPFKYELNLFYNIKEEHLKNALMRTILTEGGKTGILSVYIVDKNTMLDKEGKIPEDTTKALSYFDFKIFLENSKWFAKGVRSDAIREGGVITKIPLFESTSIEFNRSFVTEKFKELSIALADSKKSTVLYEELQEKYAKELFTKDTLTGIDICVGFRDGNLDKPEYVRLDDELVHALMGGKTGSGKSNTINVFLSNLLRNYSPEWLELYMIDFKNVEFNFYTEEIDKGAFRKKISKLPHVSMMAGTTDPEYALSVFRNAIGEMERRKKLLGKGIKIDGKLVTFKKIESYNRFVLENNLRGRTDDNGVAIKIIPRILILLDEFQVMFKMEDSDKLQIIKNLIERLSREARSMGIHMFFTSQSMDGTLNDDVKGQFAMRFCLSATAQTSSEVLGNPAASKLTGKGFIYFSGTMERKEEDNRLYKVPFIPEKYLTDMIEEIREEANRIHTECNVIPVHKTEFYDESDKHSGTELGAYLSHKKVRSERNSIILGPKVIFKRTANPENFIIGHDDSENIMVTANDKIALANIINSLIDNFASKERTNVAVFNADRTLDGMIRADKVHDFYKDGLKTNDVLPYLTDIIESFIVEDEDSLTDSEKSNMKIDAIFGNAPDDSDYVPEKFNSEEHSRWAVFIIGLNKAVGFSEDFVDDKYIMPLMKLLKQGPQNGINLVLNYKAPFKVNKMMPFINHRISARVDEDISFNSFNNRVATQLLAEENLYFGYYLNNMDGKNAKFKIYNYRYDESLLKAKELENIDMT